MSERTWCICCPGHSLSLFETHARIRRLDPDVLVAVNGAVIAGFLFDYWVIQDIEVIEEMCSRWPQETHKKDTTVFFPDRWHIDIPRYFPQLQSFFYEFIHKPFPSQTNVEFNETMPFGREINWRECTMFMAIALAIKERAELIYLFGADLSGKGYYIKGIENGRTRHTEGRWKDEAVKLAIITEECNRQGIKIIKESVR